MKSKMNLKSIVIMAAVGIVSLFFINMSFAANTAKVNVETANLRETPDENAKILELLSVNEEVEVIEKVGDWYQVKAKGIKGYLREDLITVKEESEATKNETENKEVEEAENNETEAKVESSEVESQEKEIGLGKQKVTENTKLKIVPVINATNIIEVKENEEVEVIEIINGWACIETQNTKGWIRKEKLKKEEPKTEQEETKPEETVQETTQVQEQKPTVIKTLYVNSTSINVRKEANTSSEIIANLPVNTAVEVIAENNGWSQVKFSGKEGYILSTLLSAQKQETSRAMTTPRTEENQKETAKEEAPSGKGSTVVETAQKYIGSKYVYGGSSPSGFDCSGFTSYVYKQHGITLNRTAAGQYSNGVAVDRGNLQPGDLVMFGKSGINHVGIYIGGGRIVHAANPSRGVTTDTINSGYYNNNYVGARRVM